MDAFILIEVLVGKAMEAGHAIEQIPGIRSTDVVTGCYDVIARAESRGRNGFEGITAEIRAMPFVTRVLLCPMGTMPDEISSGDGKLVAAGARVS